MTKSRTEGWTRLTIGTALNAGIWPVWRGVSLWSSYDREYRLALIAGGLAAATLVSVIPIFWRGLAWQAVVGVVLLWLPVFVLFSLFSLILTRT
jgi:hypothetical protein